MKKTAADRPKISEAAPERLTEDFSKRRGAAQDAGRTKVPEAAPERLTEDISERRGAAQNSGRTKAPKAVPERLTEDISKRRGAAQNSGRTKAPEAVPERLTEDISERRGAAQDAGRTKIPEAYRPCLRSCFAILEYADNTENSLRRKLAERGYSAEAVEFCVDFLKKNRLFSEEAFALRFSKALAEKKFFGPLRIRAEMRKKGFRPESIALAFGESEGVNADFGGAAEGEIFLAELDFAGNCAILIKKAAGGPAYPHLRRWLQGEDAEEESSRRPPSAFRAESPLQKELRRLRAALARAGYTGEQIREGFRRVKEEPD